MRREVRAEVPLIEDACQFAWWRLVVHANRVERRAALSWLAKTAVHEAIKLIRREERDVSLEARLDGAGEAAIPSRWPGPDQVAEQRAQLELLHALPVRQRTVLLLQAAGFSYEETGRKPRHVPSNGGASDHARSPEAAGSRLCAGVNPWERGEKLRLPGLCTTWRSDGAPFRR